MLIHQPLGGRRGQATDIDIQAREILRMREIINQMLAKHTGQPLERVQDVDRDYIMNAQQAKEYGIVDEIIAQMKGKEAFRVTAISVCTTRLRERRQTMEEEPGSRILRCSFCHKPQDAVGKLIAGPPPSSATSVSGLQPDSGRR